MSTPTVTFHSHSEKHCKDALIELKKILSSHLLFHALMIFAIVIQLVMLFSLYLYFPSSTYIALSISVLIFSFFSYVIFSYYISAKKPDQLEILKETYIEECLEFIDPYITPEQALNSCLFTFVKALETDVDLWKPFQKIPVVSNWIDTIIWEDHHMLQELLMLGIIEHQTELIKKQPLNLQFHNALAKTYIAMSKIYQNPKLLPFFKTHLKEKYLLQFEEITKLSIEELKIIDRLSPEDPWVHAQLAFCYQNLEMKEQEIAEFEKLSKLRPGDENVLYRLGKLYFEMNKHADALKIYERLYHLHPQKAQDLINIYDMGIKKVFTSF